jgi:hypothetical protein
LVLIGLASLNYKRQLVLKTAVMIASKTDWSITMTTTNWNQSRIQDGKYYSWVTKRRSIVHALEKTKTQ